MKHLFLALNTKGYGETILGIRLADVLRKAGHESVFLIHESSVPLFEDKSYPYYVMYDHLAPLMKLIIRAYIEEQCPSTVVLSDYRTTQIALDRFDVEPEFLKSFGLPVVAIDTWDRIRSGNQIDVFGRRSSRMLDWSDFLDNVLIPAPIGNPTVAGHYYSALPSPIKILKERHEDFRAILQIGTDEYAVLFCSAQWQHTTYTSTSGNRLATTVPFLIADYIRRAGGNVHLVHIGPCRLPVALGNRYHWIPPLPPERFDSLLGCMDLLLSANISATTISKALVSGIPCLTLINSYKVQSAKNIPSFTNRGPSPQLRQWLKSALPLYKFYLWPLGFYDFLQPVLTNNPYCNVVGAVEILDEQNVLDSLQRLLFDHKSIREHKDRQAAYVESIKTLYPDITCFKATSSIRSTRSVVKCRDECETLTVDIIGDQLNRGETCSKKTKRSWG